MEWREPRGALHPRGMTQENLLSFPSGSPSGDEMENWMVKFSWMRESKDMIVVDRL